MAFQFTPFEPPPALRQILRRSFSAKGRIAYRFDKILPNGLAAAVFNSGAPHRLGKAENPENNPRFAHSWLTGLQSDGSDTIATLEADCAARGLIKLAMPFLRPLIRRADGNQLALLRDQVTKQER
ncbi:MAG: hypothetical protein AAF495_15760 [Pseudomonadota bacterium]